MSIPFEEPEEWPAQLPPFLTTGGFGFAPDGRLWVERTTPNADAQRQYDVLDEQGQLVQRVHAPPGRRLAGFGRRSIYLIRRDDLDLEYVERYSFSFIRRETATPRRVVRRRQRTSTRPPDCASSNTHFPRRGLRPLATAGEVGGLA
jgi:hypothetical protein